MEFYTSSPTHCLPGFSLRGTDLDTFASISYVPLRECLPCPPGMYSRGDKTQGMYVPGYFCGGGAFPSGPASEVGSWIDASKHTLYWYWTMYCIQGIEAHLCRHADSNGVKST